MSENDIHGIQQGWTVKSVDDQSVGTVEERRTDTSSSRPASLATTHLYLPAVTLAHVRPELNEIGPAEGAEEVEQGDWSEPPARGPRREGAPLNADSEEEADAITRGPDGPDKPAEALPARVASALTPDISQPATCCSTVPSAAARRSARARRRTCAPGRADRARRR